MFQVCLKACGTSDCKLSHVKSLHFMIGFFGSAKKKVPPIQKSSTSHYSRCLGTESSASHRVLSCHDWACCGCLPPTKSGSPASATLSFSSTSWWSLGNKFGQTLFGHRSMQLWVRECIDWTSNVTVAFLSRYVRLYKRFLSTKLTIFVVGIPDFHLLFNKTHTFWVIAAIMRI